MMSHKLELISYNWREVFGDFLTRVKNELIVVSPYIRQREAEFVTNNLQKNTSIATVTQLDKGSLLNGGLEVGALSILNNFSNHSKIINLPRLHAKIYLADNVDAIVTSANLTTSGIEYNYEFGLRVSGEIVVQQIRKHVDNYQKLGKLVVKSELLVLEQKLCAAIQKRKELNFGGETAAERELDDECQRLHVGKDTPTALFKGALRHILTLAQDGLTTNDIQAEVQALYSGLCSDDSDRIIDGINYGRRWKHHLRNAQQSLKRAGEIKYEKTSRRWSLV